MKYLDNLSLAKIRNFRRRLGHPLSEGQLSGRYHSRRQGFSQEFAQHRTYVPGDDVKFLDWKAYARRDRFYIKEFQEETNIRTTLLLDASGSMAFGDKWECACRFAASLGYLGLLQGDAVGLTAFDSAIRLQLTARRQMHHLQALDQSLSSLAPGGETHMERAINSILQGLPRKSHAILISDLWEEPQYLLKLLKSFRASGREIWVLQVLDPKERDMAVHGYLQLEDMETRRQIRCRIESVVEEYREEFSRWIKLLESSLRSWGVPYWTAFTDIPWEQNLLKFLSVTPR